MQLLRKNRLRYDPLQWVYLIAIVAMTLAVLWVYRDIDRTLRIVHRDFLQNQTDMAYEFAQNIERKLTKLIPDHPQRRLSKDRGLQKDIDKALEMFSTDHYRYIYILHYDGKNLHYLADGTKEKSERGIFGQKFDPDDTAWRKALKTQRPQVSLQKDYTGLWLTYYYPIRGWGGNDLLVFDISVKTYANFQHLLQPIRRLLQLLSLLMLALLIFTIVWSILYYWQRRKNSVDPLTHLYNRNLLLRIKNRIDLSTTSVLLLDIDHFKRINDRYGHDVGDKVLVHVANTLRLATRADDLVIRYGGEEFLIFIVDVPNPKKAIKIADRIQKIFHSRPLHIGNETIRITLSAGLVPSPGRLMSVDEAIHFADKMLYIAKTNGRDRLVVFNEESGIEQRALLFKEITTLMDEGGLFFCYQPIVDAHTKQTVRYEMLARLRGKERVYMPHEFIPSIRGTLAYRQMSKQMIETAIDTIRRHRVAVSVNFDVNDFLDETLFEMLYDQLQAHPPAARQLTIELLEENAPPNVEILAQKIRKLRYLDIKVALDDYGKGYAGLGYLIHFRPDFVKIDRSILLKALEDPHIVSLLKNLANAAHELGIKVVAEGIESEKMADIVKKIDIEYVQGYLFGRPFEKFPGEDENR